MKSLTKQKGVVTLVLAVFVGLCSYVGGVVTAKAMHDANQKDDVAYVNPMPACVAKSPDECRG